MRFSTLAVLFTAVSATYALPLRAKARRDLFAILKPRMNEGNAGHPVTLGPPMDPERHRLAHEQDLKSLKETIGQKEITGEESQKIIDAYDVAKDSYCWQWKHGPREFQLAAYTELNNEPVWIIASRGSIPDMNEELLRDEYQSILLVQQEECLNGWTKDAKGVYYIVSKGDERCAELGRRKTESEHTEDEKGRRGSHSSTESSSSWEFDRKTGVVLAKPVKPKGRPKASGKPVFVNLG